MGGLGAHCGFGAIASPVTDDVHAVARLVLHDHEGRTDLAVLAEMEDGALRVAVLRAFTRRGAWRAIRRRAANLRRARHAHLPPGELRARRRRAGVVTGPRPHRPRDSCQPTGAGGRPSRAGCTARTPAARRRRCTQAPAAPTPPARPDVARRAGRLRQAPQRAQPAALALGSGVRQAQNLTCAAISFDAPLTLRTHSTRKTT